MFFFFDGAVRVLLRPYQKFLSSVLGHVHVYIDDTPPFFLVLSSSQNGDLSLLHET